MLKLPGDMQAMQMVDLERKQLRAELFRQSKFRNFMPTQDLRHRIHFLGQVTDDEMVKFYHALDYALHPYIKTKSGQSGSGLATMALEFGTKSFFSNAPVFREIHQYFPGAMSFFNVGNFVELAQSVQRYPLFEAEIAANRETALKTYNPAGGALGVGSYADNAFATLTRWSAELPLHPVKGDATQTWREPKAPLSFVWLDLDRDVLMEPVLQGFLPMLTPDSIIGIDDVGRPQTPTVRPWVDSVLRQRPAARDRRLSRRLLDSFLPGAAALTRVTPRAVRPGPARG